MSSPRYAGSAAIARRWQTGPSRILWIGDSIGVGLAQRALGNWPVNPGGYGPLTLTSLNSNARVTLSQGSLGSTGVSGATNSYSIATSFEGVFTGVVYDEVGSGLPDLENRIMEDAGGSGFLALPRADYIFSATDWFNTATALKFNAVVHRISTSADGVVKLSVVDGTNHTILGTSAALSLSNATPTYTLYQVSATNPDVSAACYFEAQAPNVTPVLNSNVMLAFTWVSTGNPTGMTVYNLSQGGWWVGDFLDTTKISAAAWAGMLPLLDPTDVVISLTQNNTPSTANFNSLVALIRSTLPNVSITFLATHDTVPSDRSPYVDNMYASYLATSNAMWINVFAAAGDADHLDTSGVFVAGGVHLTEAGQRVMLAEIWGLVNAVADGGGGRTSHSHLPHLIG